jgi:proline iminopeptidase
MKCFLCLLAICFSGNLAAQRIDSVFSDNATIYFQVFGEGEPVYLLSGGPGIDPDYMIRLADTLSTSYEVVLIHQRGTGTTKAEPLEAFINIALYCRDIHAVKEKMKHSQFILLGHSWGGMLAMHYMTLFPQDVSKLLLVSSGGCSLYFFSYFGDNIDARLSKEQQDSVGLFLRQYAEVYRSPESTPQQKADVTFSLFRVRGDGYVYDKKNVPKKRLSPDNFNLPVNQVMINQLFRSQWNICDDLSRVATPTLIVIGRQDPVDLETARLINTSIPGSTLEIIERCGHFPWVEQEEKFIEVVMQFLGT